MRHIFGRGAAKTPAKFPAELRRLPIRQRVRHFFDAETAIEQQHSVTHPLAREPLARRTGKYFSKAARESASRQVQFARQLSDVVLGAPRQFGELLRGNGLRWSGPGEKSIRLHLH